jgi:hypothetical protein
MTEEKTMSDVLIDWECDLCHYDKNPQTETSCEACGYASSDVDDMPIAEWLQSQGVKQ